MVSNGTKVRFDIEGSKGTAEIIDTNDEDKKHLLYKLEVLEGDDCEQHKEDGVLWVNADELVGLAH